MPQLLLAVSDWSWPAFIYTAEDRFFVEACAASIEVACSRKRFHPSSSSGFG